MDAVKYRIVEHDGGWAYRVDGTYSETFPSHDAAFGAARRAKPRASSGRTRLATGTRNSRAPATGPRHRSSAKAVLRSLPYHQNRQASALDCDGCTRER